MAPQGCGTVERASRTNLLLTSKHFVLSPWSISCCLRLKCFLAIGHILHAFGHIFITIRRVTLNLVVYHAHIGEAKSPRPLTQMSQDIPPTKLSILTRLLQNVDDAMHVAPGSFLQMKSEEYKVDVTVLAGPLCSGTFFNAFKRVNSIYAYNSYSKHWLLFEIGLLAGSFESWGG